jgi:hypothetical protein
MLLLALLNKIKCNNVSLLSRILRSILLLAIAVMVVSILIVLIVEDYWSLYNKVYAIFIYGSIIYSIYALVFSFLVIAYMAIRAMLGRKNMWESVKCEAWLLIGVGLGMFLLHVLILSGY